MPSVYRINNRESRIVYPVLVTESVSDVVCQKCRTYPAINFCNGPRIISMDQEAATILEIETGSEYTEEMLKNIFDTKAEALGLGKGEYYGSILLKKFGMKH